jgi:PBSX family phage terminase large subunit
MFRVQPLSEKQKRSFNEAKHRINIWCGSVRSGKSYAALLCFLDFCINGPPGLCAIVGRSERTIRQNVINMLSNFCGGDIDYKIGYGEIQLYGRKVYVVGASDARAEGRILGATYAGALVDEATLLPENVWRTLLDRLSIPGARLFATTNPDSPFHWLKRDFLDRANELDIAYWDFHLEDNPSLDPIYVKNIKKENTGVWYKRRIEGLWTMAQGAVYSMFNQDRHVIDEIPGIASEYYIGVDHGQSNPTAFVMLGYNPTLYPNMWIEKEYYWDSKKEGREKTVGQYAEDLKSFTGNLPIDGIFVDPSAAAFKTEVRSRFRDLPIVDANNNVLEGIGIHASLLNEGTLKIHSSCKNLIGEYTAYVWDDAWQLRGIDKPLKHFDHCFSGQTLISTPIGKKEIQKINIGDYVLTSNGKKRVLKKFKRLAKVYSYNILGIEFESTDSHKFFTINRNYVKLTELKSNDIFVVNLLCQKKLFGMESNGEDILTLKRFQTETITGLTSKERDVNFTIESYGNGILGQFHQNTIFITKTKILPIMTLAICSVLDLKNTFPSIQKILLQNKDGLLKILANCEFKELPNGTNQKKEGFGTKNTQKNLDLVTGKKKNTDALIATNNSCPKKEAKQNFVQITVNHQQGELCSLIIFKKNVPNVISYFLDASMHEGSVAAKLAETSFLKEDFVYDITVEDDHQYFANNILVSNCQDATRYILATRFQHGVYPAKRGYQPPEKAWDPMSDFFTNKNMGYR